MQLARPLTLICMLTTLLLGACTSHKINYDLHTAIVGTWKGDQSGAMLTIYSDGRFVLENAAGMTKDTPVKGTLQRGRGQILFVYSSPSALCPDSNGLYTFSRESNVLTLEVVSDDCPQRNAQIDHTWTLSNPIPTLLN